MPIHPQTARVLACLATSAQLDYSALDVERFRATFQVPSPSASLRSIAAVSDRLIAVSHGALRLRLYRPHGAGPFPITLYFHGGGFVVGSPETTEGICRNLAHHAQTMVVSVDYRLAPEAPFPCALEDAISALSWARAHAEELGGIAGELAVAGDSSGGNLAAALAQVARDEGIALRHQLLFYPVLDCCFDTLSYATYRDGLFLTEAMMRWFWGQYLAQGGAPEDWRASPLRRRNLSGLPSATIVTAEYDVLRDEAESYAERLRDASVAVEVRRWAGQIHGFLLFDGVVDDATTAVEEAGAALGRAFSRCGAR